MLRTIVKYSLRYVIPLVISVGLCWVLFRNDSFEEMWNVARTKCDFRWMWLMLFIESFSFVFRTLRWRIQLNGVNIRAPFKEVLYSIFGTYGVNIVLPRVGEVWRCGYISQRRNAPFGTVFGTMVADRFADVLMSILLLVLTLGVSGNEIVAFIRKYPAGYEAILRIITSPWLWSIAVLFIAGLIIFLRSRSQNKIVNKIKAFMLELWKGFSAIVTMPHRGLWLLWTVMLWGCYFMQLVVAFQAFPFTQELFSRHGLSVVLICFTLTTIALGIPSNGGIGPYQIAMIFGLGMFLPAGLDAEATKVFEMDSKTFANIVLTLSTLLMIAVGLWAFIAIAFDKRKSRH
ncbi:MAG: flippase-like domain-containing protein [Bacteroidales bacterium]|nr:flippase-like domain-containing protein [Bacteroidales bacterium]